MLDFQRIKEIRITDVCLRYGVPLTFGGKYAKAKCPLPTHKQGDRDKNFNINLEGNFWKCWSGSCNEKAGGKGGDVINFVALMENCSQHDAAKRLSEWFHVPETQKPGTHIEHRASEKSRIGKSQKNSSDHTSPSGSVKVDTKGYMQDVDRWFDEMIARGDQEDDEQYLHRVRNAVKSRLVLSFRNGKRVAAGLPLES
jgi:DNA primase